jgi:hypothetical protein
MGAESFTPDKSRGNARTRPTQVSNDFGGAGLLIADLGVIGYANGFPACAGHGRL